jgi:hypothetical protein
MRTFYLAAVSALLAASLLTGCGGPAPYSPPTATSATYEFAQPIALNAVGSVLLDGQSTLRFQQMQLQAVFEPSYRGSGRSLTLVLKDGQGVEYSLTSGFAGGELAEAWFLPEERGPILRAHVLGVFSEQHFHFNGTIMIQFRNGAEYSMPVSADATL